MTAVKPSRGDAGRARVIQAAIEAIAESGPDRVTMRQIAAIAGMSPGHVTYYFPISVDSSGSFSFGTGVPAAVVTVKYPGPSIAMSRSFPVR